MTVLMYYSVLTWYQLLICMLWDSGKTISGCLRRSHPGETTKIVQQTKSDDIISEYLLWTNGQLFEMNVKVVSSYLQAGKAFDPMQHD